MMAINDRRNFLTQFATLGGAITFSPFIGSVSGQQLLTAFSNGSLSSDDEMDEDEEFWRLIQQAYTVSPTILNLNNGGVSPQPKIVQEAVEHYNRLSNEAPSHYMWHILDKGRDALREKLAELAGCSPAEVAINRNSSEALETVIFGLRLNKGDEVILTRQDYPNMINAWKQRQHRDGVVLKWLDFNFPIEDDDIILGRFMDAVTPKTKVMHITHVINWTGQVLPVKKIASEARKRGIEVVVDGAHSFAHLDFKVGELGCDYFGTSLHKWLGAPFGSGMLYVRREKIKKLYPLFAAQDPEWDDIQKFEQLGTRSFAIEYAIAQAINFHNLIGHKRKIKRLHYLKNYWVEKALKIPGVSMGTSLKSGISGAIALLKIRNRTPQEVGAILFSEFNIHTATIEWENIHGVRITPNVYVLPEDLDRLVSAIREIAS